MTSPSESLAVDEEMTPEKVRTLLATIKKMKALRYESLRLLAELEHTLVAKVGEPRELYMPRWKFSRKQMNKHCEHCGQDFNDGSTHKVVEFDGRYWHVWKCK